MNARFTEPGIPPRLQRSLAAVWISLGLHAALIALVQVAPPASGGRPGAVIEARLVSGFSRPPAPAPLTVAPLPVADAQVEVTPVPAPDKFTEPPSAPAAPDRAPASVATPPATAPSPVIAMPSAVDLTYYSAREVDVHPRALQEVTPVYPDEADQQKLSGTLRLSLKLEADGRVSDVQVVSADPPELFDASALAAFRAARFAPAQKNGRAVRAQVMIELVYDWAGRQK